MRHIFDAARNRLVAIRPGGSGDVTATHVLWEREKDLPYVSSPLCYKGLLFLAKDGGLISALDARTGQAYKQARVVPGATYYSSPVGGDGKVYLASQRGDLLVLSAEPQWRVLSRPPGTRTASPGSPEHGRLPLRRQSARQSLTEPSCRAAARVRPSAEKARPWT
jgi:outer membrane protein assembly factor BamB